MSAKKLGLFTFALAMIIVACAGFGLANIAYTYEICSGDVVSTDLCEPARLGRTIFGAVITGSAIIAAAVIVAAAMLSGGRKRSSEK